MKPRTTPIPGGRSYWTHMVSVIAYLVLSPLWPGAEMAQAMGAEMPKIAAERNPAPLRPLVAA